MPNRSHHKGPTKEEGFQFAAHSGKQSWQKKRRKEEAHCSKHSMVPSFGIHN
jgi:hypothetical protein